MDHYGVTGCWDCPAFQARPEFGHPICQSCWLCFAPRDNEPVSCNVCFNNRILWDPNTSECRAWWGMLRCNQNRLNDRWSFRAAFTGFFEFFIDSGSAAGSLPQFPVSRARSHSALQAVAQQTNG